MKKNIIVSTLLLLFSSLVIADEANVDGLFSSWCMTGMAAELDGERSPDKATYTFTRDNILNMMRVSSNKKSRSLLKIKKLRPNLWVITK